MGLLACHLVEDGLAFQEGSQESCPPQFHQTQPPQTFTPRDSRGHGSAEVEPLPSSCILLSPPVFLTGHLISSALTLGGSCTWAPAPSRFSLCEPGRLRFGWARFRPSRRTTAGGALHTAWKELARALPHQGSTRGSPRAETTRPQGLCSHPEPQWEQNSAAVRSLQLLASRHL